MATTQTVLGINQLRGPAGTRQPLRVYEVPVRVKGTYLTASKPSFDFLAALQAQGHQGVTSVSVKKSVALRDYFDGTTQYTASNAVIALSGTGNKVTTFTVESGAVDGETGAEIADATALDDIFVFLLVATVTRS